MPANAREQELLAPFPDAVRADIMDGTWSPPVTDGSGRDRTGLRRAFALFDEAGYAIKGTTLRIARPAGRSASRSSPPPATRSASRSPLPATSSAPASMRACAASTPPSSNAAASPSIST